ncbi:MAG: hypothetical protein ACWIPJ_10015, partial [Polaribacter sp.]
GKGLIDSVINAVTSQAAKEIASNAEKQVTTKTLSEIGSQKVVNRIIPPKKGKVLTDEFKSILSKYIFKHTIPIEEYVKSTQYFF